MGPGDWPTKLQGEIVHYLVDCDVYEVEQLELLEQVAEQAPVQI